MIDFSERSELVRLHDLVDTLQREAEIHAQEARTQRATVHEIYQLVSDGKGEPGDWNGAEPVRAAIEALRHSLAAAMAERDDARMMLRLFTANERWNAVLDAPPPWWFRFVRGQEKPWHLIGPPAVPNDGGNQHHYLDDSANGPVLTPESRAALGGGK